MIIPAGYAQINVQFDGDAVPFGAEVTYGIENTGTFLASTIGDKVAVAWNESGIKAAWVADCRVFNYHVKLGPAATGPSYDRATDLVGTAAASSGYAGAALLVTKTTPLGGRHGKGRFFLPGLSEAKVTVGGGIESAFAGAIQEACDDLRVLHEDADIPMVLLHNVEMAPSTIEALNVATRAATQRRRQRR